MRPAHPASGIGAGRWLLAGLLLHAAAAQLVATLSPVAIPSAPPSPSAAGSSPEVELIFIDDEAPSVAAKGGASSASIAMERRLAEEGPSSLEVQRPLAPDVPSEASHDGSTDIAAKGAETSSPTLGLPGATSERPAQVAAPEPIDSSAPTLSLDQLGVGASNPFRSFASTPPPLARENANQRLQASLRAGSGERDGQRMLGPEGPVLRAAHQLVMADEMLVETSAIVDVRVDATGRVASLDLSSASSQIQDWRRLADNLLKTLGPTRLQLAGGNEGLSFKLRLASRMQLPSGAAPGVRLDLFGQTLHEGAGPGSTSLSLSPTAPLQAEQAFDTAGRHQDHPMQLELGLFELRGDVADAAARPRRVVQVTVLAWNGKKQ